MQQAHLETFQTTISDNRWSSCHALPKSTPLGAAIANFAIESMVRFDLKLVSDHRLLPTSPASHGCCRRLLKLRSRVCVPLSGDTVRRWTPNGDDAKTPSLYVVQKTARLEKPLALFKAFLCWARGLPRTTPTRAHLECRIVDALFDDLTGKQIRAFVA